MAYPLSVGVVETDMFYDVMNGDEGLGSLFKPLAVRASFSPDSLAHVSGLRYLPVPQSGHAAAAPSALQGST